VYSTCSILKAENEQQAERFLQRHPEFEETELPVVIPEVYRKYKARGLQLLEYRDGIEGFYLIRMRRKHD
jgi:16S rRNA (cytosine967-C5)-methyltransferase